MIPRLPVFREPSFFVGAILHNFLDTGRSMLKFLIFAGALVWLIFGYGGGHSSVVPTASPNDPPQASAPWQGVAGSLGKTFWTDQAKAGTALWHRSLAWCEQQFQEATQPTVTDGVCTVILGIRNDLGNPDHAQP
jgi:hypothetical protein